ncbi:MAG: ABC transporter substrate-binding protein, partial [Gemmatimonadota bacterium]|nr:ABC transporter substrate-binding protein [Gemmatimonadota bacterium]
FTNLERGVIDATEWIGPYHDTLMGFYKAAKYYYYPGWHEPGTVIELIVNKSAYQTLPKNLQDIVRTAAARANAWTLSEFEAKNNAHLQTLIKDHNVILKKFPDEVLDILQKYAREVEDELVAADAMSKKVYEAYESFRKKMHGWAAISEKIYYENLSA